jgi:hypothetical protein
LFMGAALWSIPKASSSRHERSFLSSPA